MFPWRLRDDVSLEPLEEKHASEVFAAVDRERAYLRRWLPWVDHTLKASDSLAFIQTASRQFADNEGLTLGIWCGGELSGTIGTHKIDWLNRRVELGYWIAAHLQGRGIITEACRAVIRHAFKEWKLHRVEIHCATGNQKSCVIPERLGFRFEGTLRQAQLVNGAYYDIRVYAMLAEEWRASG